MKVAVKDSGLLIDLDLMGVLDLWFLLEIETITTDQIFREVRFRHPNVVAHVDSGSLKIHQIGLSRVLNELDRAGYEKLSPEDVSILILARDKRAMLLTCDGSLRKEAKGQAIEVHGSIWVMDRLVKANLLSGEVAAFKLETLMNLSGTEKRFIPIKEAETFIDKWLKDDG